MRRETSGSEVVIGAVFGAMGRFVIFGGVHIMFSRIMNPNDASGFLMVAIHAFRTGMIGGLFGAAIGVGVASWLSSKTTGAGPPSSKTSGGGPASKEEWLAKAKTKGKSKKRNW